MIKSNEDFLELLKQKSDVADKALEKSADEMFAELGYKKQCDIMGNIQYYKNDYHAIYFYSYNNTFAKTYACNYIDMQELKAINKKAEELRMDIEELSKEIKRCYFELKARGFNTFSLNKRRQF